MIQFVQISPSEVKGHLLSEDLVTSVHENVPQKTFSSLLKILKNHHIDIPVTDARSILKTPRNIFAAIKKMDQGFYYLFSFLLCLKTLIEKSKTYIPNNVLSVNVNVDGLPIAKSSSNQLWPIMINLSNRNKVEIVGLYQGLEKPKSSNVFQTNS